MSNIVRILYLSYSLLVLFPLCALAQEQEQISEKKGEAIIQVFTNFHTGFGSVNDERGFELDRSYLGYQYKLAEGLNIKAIIDFGQSRKVDDFHHIAYIKNAQLSWKKKNFSVCGGLISTTQFNLQEKFWGYRYIMKSFQDKYRFGSSADLGISVSYKFLPFLSADAIVCNGEGYKKIQVKNGLEYGLGVTLTPIKNLIIRLYANVNETSDNTYSNIWNYAGFIGYKNNCFSLGAEYNYMQNQNHIKNADCSGLSIYSSVNIGNHTSIIARYDNLYSRKDWNINKDEQAILLGAHFDVHKYVKLAPNVRVIMLKASGAKTECYAFLNCYFGI